MRQVSAPRPRRRVVLGVGLLLAPLLGACGEDLYAGSDVQWMARHETGDFTEWTSAQGRVVTVSPNTIEVEKGQAHTGGYAARLSISAPPDATQTSASLVREGNLPKEAYYSAWYYLPSAISVGEFWVIMKFRIRRIEGDPTSEDELLDVDLRSKNGEMSLYVYDHRRMAEYPLDPGANSRVPIQSWFQIEAFYRDAQDATGRATFWLDGRQILDMTGQSISPTPWVSWDVGSIGQNLTPSTAVLFIDDAAVSGSRVGPTGKLVR